MTTSQTPEPNQDKDPAQRDAERLKYHYPLSFLIKLLALLLVLFLVVCIAFYIMAGTERGTKFILEKIISETGVELQYQEGNLRDGMLIKDITMSASEDVDIHFVNTYVKIGWRALFTKEVHLRDADIESIVIENRQPPSGDPFQYKEYQLPVSLRFDKANIDEIIYNQAGKDPVVVTDVKANDLYWVGTEVEVGSGNFQYSDVVKVADLEGSVILEDQYPLDLSAVVTVNSLEKVYIDPIEVEAIGSVKRTYGKLRSKYNDSNVRGVFTVQGLDENAPFEAKLNWDEIDLPYAEGQEIKIINGLATASGVVSDIDLRINSHLSAKNIPTGRYKGRANIVDGQKMLVHRLTAQTPNGDLLAKGVLDWQNVFTTKAMLYSRDYKIRAILPEAAAPYAPKFLDGKLALVYNQKNQDGLLQINSKLIQRDGEQITAQLVRGSEPDNPRFSAPWYIDASWRNLLRYDVPQVGDIESPMGTAKVSLRDDRLWVDANAAIDKLNAAPAGDYQVKLNKFNNKIKLQNLDYVGVMGDLKGSGNILLATEDTPLTWDIDAYTNKLKPQAFSESIPVKQLAGEISAKGKMIDIIRQVQGKKVKGQQHVFTINSSDLSSTLTAQVNTGTDSNGVATSEDRKVDINGVGDGIVEIVEGSLQKFDARFNGQVGTQGLPKGKLVVDANGTAKNINIKTLSHSGEAGKINAAGNVNLKDGVQWQVNAKANNFNIGFLTSETEGIVSGDLKTSGKWRSNNTKLGDLRDFDVKFNGSIDTPQLPKGKLTVDAGGNANTINIRDFSHIGEAGSLIAKGKVDVSKGLTWNLNAAMDNFNLSYFVKDLPSDITGRIASTGRWQDTVQQISINEMAIRGEIDGEPLLAQGKLNTTLHLPKDMGQYLELLKTTDTNDQVKKVNSIVETLNANNLLLKWGDNQIVANGNTERLEAKLEVNNLAQINKNFSGSILGGLTLVQDRGQSQALPTIYVDLSGSKLVLPGLFLERGVVKGKVVELAKKPSTLMVMADGIEASGSKFKNVNAVFKGTEQQHSFTIQGDTTSANNVVSIKAAINGGFNRKTKSWSGVIGNGELSSEYVTLAQSQPAELIANFGGESPKIQLAAHCWQATDQSGKICLRENLIASADKGQVNVAIQKIDTTLFAPFMPKDLSWQASLNGKAVVEWGKGIEPVINATLYSDDGKLGLVQEGQDEPVTVPYKRVSLIVRSFDEGLKLRTDIDNGSGAKGYADVVIDPYQENKPISGALVLNEFNLAILKPFFPGMRKLQGNATMAGGLGGTLSSPVFYGDLNLKDATVAMLDLPVNLTNINAKAKIRGQSATLDGTFMSGEGDGQLSGTVDWQQELQAKLRVTGEGLVITQPPLLYAEVDPDFNIIVKPQQKYVNIVGAVSVPTATIRPPEANEEVVTKSDDVVVLDRQLIGNIEEVLAISQPWSINADIGVDLGDNVNFRGFGAVLPLAGAVHITQNGQGVMNALGVVQVSRRSTVDVFGQNLELNYAQVRFRGDVTNPTLSIEASKEIEGRTVGLRVKDRVSEPNITVFNNAGLTQQQAMNALVTGRISNSGATQISEEGFKSEVTNNLAAAGLSLGLTGTRSLTNTIGDAFGLERLTIDASGTDSDTNVNVTGYITPDLYIRYGVGVFNAQSSLSLRYQLTRRIYVEATSSVENAVDVVYSFSF